MTAAARHPKLRPVAPIAAASGAACALAAVWALWPVAAPSIPLAADLLASDEGGGRGRAPDESPVAFDPAAFHTPLWIAVAPEPPPPPPPTPPAPPPVPPLRATLLAIARDASLAIVHDAESDRVATLRVGDALQGRTVHRIEPSRVTLTLDGRTQTLELGYSIGAVAPPRRDASAAPGQEGAP